MTADEVIAWVKETRGITVSADSARRMAGLLEAGRAALDTLTDDSLFDAEPSQMVLALKDGA